MYFCSAWTVWQVSDRLLKRLFQMHKFIVASFIKYAQAQGLSATNTSRSWWLTSRKCIRQSARKKLWTTWFCSRISGAKRPAYLQRFSDDTVRWSALRGSRPVCFPFSLPFRSFLFCPFFHCSTLFQKCKKCASYFSNLHTLFYKLGRDDLAE